MKIWFLSLWNFSGIILFAVKWNWNADKYIILRAGGPLYTDCWAYHLDPSIGTVLSLWYVSLPLCCSQRWKKKKTTKKPTPQNPGVLFLITGLACLTAWKGFHLFWMPSHPSEYLGTKTILNGCEQPHRTQSLGALDRNIFQVCSPEAFSEMLAQWFRLLPPHTSKLVWVSLYDSLVQNIKKKKKDFS